MAINYDIWGAPETWVNSSDFPYADIKTAKTDCNTFKKNYDNGNIPYNTIDLSLAFWGIGKNAFFAQPKYLSPYTDNGVTGVKVDRVHESVNIPCMFTTTREENALQAYNQRYKPNVATITENTGAYNSAMICTFNYQKVMIVPYVMYKKPDSDSVVGWDLKSYIDEDMVLGYTQIVNIGYKMWTGDGIDTNRYASYECGFAPVFTHDVDNYDVRYNNKIFYARGGYSQLTRGGTRNNNRGTMLAPYYSAYDRITKNNTVDMTTALAYRYTVAEDANPNEIWYYFDDNPLWQINGDSATSGYWCTFPYIHCDSNNVDDVKEYILQQLSFLGLPFCYDPTTALRGQIGDLGVYLPKFDTDGITTGEYEEGDAALRLPNADWTDGRTGSGYDPTRKPGNEDFGDLSNRRPTRVSPGGLNLYVTNYQTIYNLQRYLNGAYTPSAADLTADFKGTNPGDYIVSAFKFPVALPANQTLEEIYIGKIPSGFQAYRLTDNAYLDFGTIDIDPYFSTTIDFRDYQSKILLLMPFIGTAELDPKAFIGHSLSLIYNVDYLTGSVAAEIKRDGLTIETRTAKLAQTVPFFAGNMGAYQNEIAQTGFAIEQSKIKQITGAITTMFSIGGAAATAAGGGSELAGLGSGAGIIRGASNMLLERINQESLEYRLEHTQPQIGTISTASAGNAFLLDDRARVLIWRPYMLPGYDPETYSHVVGNATLRAAALSEFSGYTVAAAAELANVYTIDGTKSASEQELKLIKQALLAGVYV